MKCMDRIVGGVADLSWAQGQHWTSAFGQAGGSEGTCPPGLRRYNALPCRMSFAEIPGQTNGIMDHAESG
eukprot:CAMPEP_0170632196 /NCGR_PEP_ID=MMETSP0224-20130122/35167_1 /TAXON_ID=285029 /ORGANISM="Togula jolla, Strain CCCM 725" /LENGTH=69 /DNA_ID=CAMNT_0010960829 /DNA_START=124 /DNA_END=332 /DNA_ORIENTATION=+